MVKDTMLNATSAADGTFTIADVPAGTVTVMAKDLMFYDYLRYDASGTDAMNTSVAVVDAAVTLGDDLVVEEAALPVTLVTPDAMINVSLDSTIVFKFSEEMNVSLVEENFELTKSGGGNPIAGSWNVSADNMTFTFTPGAMLENNETYVITITKDVKGTDGDPVFWKNYEATFTTVMAKPEPLTATINVGGQALTTALTDIAVDAEITVVFSLKMDKTTAEGNITVKTGTTDVAVTFSWDTLAMKVTLAHADFEKGTTYTVSVGTGVMSEKGMSLATAVSGQFTTASPVHTLKLMIEGEGTVELYKGETKVSSGTIANNEVTLVIQDADYAPGDYTVKVTGSGDYKNKEWTITLGDDDAWSGDGTTAAVALDKAGEDEDDDDNMMMIIIIVVIIIVIIVIMVMLAMRKKPEEEEAPVEEEEEVAGEFECPACGALVSADEKVCPECGEEFEEEEFKCPECDAPIEPDATTCEACGAEFELEEEGEEGEEGELEEGEEELEEDYEVEGEEEDLDMEGEEEDLEMEGEEEELEGDEDLEEDLVEEEDLDELDEEVVGEEDLEEDAELDKVE
jgi:RNA polymerase subunit RPABC4/transcription elongation factor Spt4